ARLSVLTDSKNRILDQQLSSELDGLRTQFTGLGRDGGAVFSSREIESFEASLKDLEQRFAVAIQSRTTVDTEDDDFTTLLDDFEREDGLRHGLNAQKIDVWRSTCLSYDPRPVHEQRIDLRSVQDQLYPSGVQPQAANGKPAGLKRSPTCPDLKTNINLISHQRTVLNEILGQYIQWFNSDTDNSIAGKLDNIISILKKIREVPIGVDPATFWKEVGSWDRLITVLPAFADRLSDVLLKVSRQEDMSQFKQILEKINTINTDYQFIIQQYQNLVYDPNRKNYFGVLPILIPDKIAEKFYDSIVREFNKSRTSSEKLLKKIEQFLAIDEMYGDIRIVSGRVVLDDNVMYKILRQSIDGIVAEKIRDEDPQCKKDTELAVETDIKRFLSQYIYPKLLEKIKQQDKLLEKDSEFKLEPTRKVRTPSVVSNESDDSSVSFKHLRIPRLPTRKRNPSNVSLGVEPICVNHEFLNLGLFVDPKTGGFTAKGLKIADDFKILVSECFGEAIKELGDVSAKERAEVHGEAPTEKTESLHGFDQLVKEDFEDLTGDSAQLSEYQIMTFFRYLHASALCEKGAFRPEANPDAFIYTGQPMWHIERLNTIYVRLAEWQSKKRSEELDPSFRTRVLKGLRKLKQKLLLKRRGIILNGEQIQVSDARENDLAYINIREIAEKVISRRAGSVAQGELVELPDTSTPLDVDSPDRSSKFNQHLLQAADRFRGIILEANAVQANLLQPDQTLDEIRKKILDETEYNGMQHYKDIGLRCELTPELSMDLLGEDRRLNRLTAMAKNTAKGVGFRNLALMEYAADHYEHLFSGLDALLVNKVQGLNQSRTKDLKAYIEEHVKKLLADSDIRSFIENVVSGIDQAEQDYVRQILEWQIISRVIELVKHQILMKNVKGYLNKHNADLRQKAVITDRRVSQFLSEFNRFFTNPKEDDIRWLYAWQLFIQKGKLSLESFRDWMDFFQNDIQELRKTAEDLKPSLLNQFSELSVLKKALDFTDERFISLERAYGDILMKKVKILVSQLYILAEIQAEFFVDGEKGYESAGRKLNNYFLGNSQDPDLKLTGPSDYLRLLTKYDPRFFYFISFLEQFKLLNRSYFENGIKEALEKVLPHMMDGDADFTRVYQCIASLSGKLSAIV
ncbi:hypothetical protein ACFL96_16690, partial [Thermoproteota archaeon]